MRMDWYKNKYFDTLILEGLPPIPGPFWTFKKIHSKQRDDGQASWVTLHLGGQRVCGGYVCGII